MYVKGLEKSEENILEKQGFYVKRIISIKEYYLNIFLLIFLTFLLISIGLSFGLVPLMILPSLFGIYPGDPGFSRFLNIMIWVLNVYIFIQIYISDYLQFLKFHKVFYISKKKFLGQKNQGKLKENSIISLTYYKNLYLEEIQKPFKKPPSRKSIKGIIIPIFISLSILIGIIFSYDWLFHANMFGNIIYFYLLVGLFTISTPFIRWLFEFFNPLFIFATVGEKIQSFTSKIEEESRQIQKNFQTDTNFRVLSDGFDTLSHTFSQIVFLVIKLERVEKRANKGNLFDSEKYINSVRSDIVEPLKSLRIFLMNQKEALLHSQKELLNVSIGGPNDSTNNLELQSKRSHSIMIELTENIEKLDVMIKKMGY